MLPSWRDEVRIGLCPDRVVVARLARRWRRQVTAKQTMRCGEPDGTDWRPCIDALQHILAEKSWQNADATVIISNHFVRYALVPWSEELISDDEKLAWVRHHFADIYGEIVANAEYRWSDDSPDALCLASAVDGELVARLRETCAGTALRLRSIQPYFMAAFNRWMRRVSGRPVWLLAAEPGRVCMASIGRGKWLAMVSKRITSDWQTEVPVVLNRQLVLEDEDTAPKTVLAYVPDVPKFEIPAWNAVPVRTLMPRALPGFSPFTDSAYAMPLTGIV